MSNPSAAMIYQSTGLNLKGVEFINTVGNTTVNKTYNFNMELPNVTGFFRFAAKHVVALIGNKKRNPVEISDIVLPDPSSLTPASSIADKYTRCMLECMVGYPLYNPKPFSDISMEYPRNGVNIGDVGFVRGDGVFDFLFNICQSQNGLINPPNLSDGFSLAELYHSPTRDLESFPPNTCFFPKSIKRTTSGEYICKESEGAVLILPEGAIQQEALNIKPFEDLAKRRGVDWYKHAMTRGRSIPNGSLYLVTSFTKCTPWGIAAFDRPCDPGEGLTFDSGHLSWNGSGALPPRVASTKQGDISNQCVFLRGYKIKLRPDIFDRLSSSSNLTVKRQRAGRIRGGGGTDSLLSKIATIGKRSTSTTKSTGKKTDEHVELHNLDTDFNTPLFHPSDEINAALLSQNPGARLALTHDDFWCELMRDNFPTLNYATLINIAQLYTSRVDEYGCVSLQKYSDLSSILDDNNRPVQGTETPAPQEPIQDSLEERNPDISIPEKDMLSADQAHRAGGECSYSPSYHSYASGIPLLTKRDQDATDTDDSTGAFPNVIGLFQTTARLFARWIQRRWQKLKDLKDRSLSRALSRVNPMIVRRFRLGQN